MGSWWGIAYPKKKGYTTGDSRVPLRVPLFFRRNDWTRGDNTKKKGCWLDAGFEIGEIRFPIRPPQIFERKCIIHIKVEQGCPKNLGWTAGVKSDIGSDTNLVWVGRRRPSSTPFFWLGCPFFGLAASWCWVPLRVPHRVGRPTDGYPFFCQPSKPPPHACRKRSPTGSPFCPFGLLLARTEEKSSFKKTK